MRLSSLAILTGTFAAAAGLCVFAAIFAVQLIERGSIEGVQATLADEGIEWAQVDANGLQVFVIGTAPTESARFKALSAAGTVVDAARVIDETQIAEAEEIAPPRFSVEILRNEDAVSLIGLVPAEFDRARLIETVGTIVGEAAGVTDLLETADFPVPDGWSDAVHVAVKALEDLPRAKVSVAPKEVAVKAMTDSAEARDRIARRLERTAGEDTELALDLSAPRPVISPFTLRFVKDGEGARFDSCSADTEAAQRRIRAAAEEAGVEVEPGCVIGLGVPSRDWGSAAAAAIRAVEALGGGSVTFANADISLVAEQGTPPQTFDNAVGELREALPEPFVLDAVLPEPPAESDAGPIEFVATQSPEGQVQLRGTVATETARTTVDSYARAAFGSDQVRAGLRVDDRLPENWQARVLAALEALAALENGTVNVTPDAFEVAGDTGNKDAEAEIAALIDDKLGETERSLSITYQKRLDPTLGIPTPAECVAEINTMTTVRKIVFEPGKAALDASAKDVLDDIAELLRKCGDIPLEIQGHTDSQGRESMNQQLSQERAESVLEALRSRRVLTASFRARGYGEERPIADNGNETGREANRRIEFHLVGAEGAESEETDSESVEDPAEAGQEGPNNPEAASEESEDEQD